MKKKIGVFLLLTGYVLQAQSQQFLERTPEAIHWSDSIMKKLNKKQKIAQLMVLRLSERQNGADIFFESEVSKYIQKYNIGSVCLFQGVAKQQAEVVNRLQKSAETPLMVCIDGETGVGMRFSDVDKFPNQLTLGAANNPHLAYELGRAIAKQCLRSGIHVNYAPSVDVNNNPLNPIINVRSFGEDKEKVARLGVQIMKGMQDHGIMACAKHFPGHGDVSVDSHLDLPVILKSKKELDELEVYPFKALINNGVASVMNAHLFIPSIDSTTNQASSLSRKNVTQLLRQDLGFKGITFTDALEMKGVAKFYPQGKAATQSLIAGNDMLCLPGDVKGSIKNIRRAIRRKQLGWEDINAKVQRVLIAKYHLGLAQLRSIDTTNIAVDLNAEVNDLKEKIYKEAVTVLRQKDTNLFSYQPGMKVAYVGIGTSKANHLAELLVSRFHAEPFYVGHHSTAQHTDSVLQALSDKYDRIIVGVHDYSKYPADNFGVGADVLRFLKVIQQKNNVVNLIFGTPYFIKNVNMADNIVACYEDDKLMHKTAADLLSGAIRATGTLPVSVDRDLLMGTGIK